MKKIHYIFGCCIVIALAFSITIAVNSCKLTESEKLEINIDSYEKQIEKIKARRDSVNRLPIPFTEPQRERILDSINRKHGFNLSLRPA